MEGLKRKKITGKISPDKPDGTHSTSDENLTESQVIATVGKKSQKAELQKALFSQAGY